MKKHRIASRTGRAQLSLKLILALLFAVGSAGLVGVGMAGTSAGQTKRDKLELGVTYSCLQMNNYEFKVISCDDKDWCQVFIVNKYSSGGGNITGQGRDTVLSLMRKGECTVKGRLPAPAESADPTGSNIRDETTGKPTPPPAQREADTAALCSSDPILTAKPKANDSIELKSKRAILARFQQSVEKGEKLAVNISFESFQIGPPRLNRRGDTLYLEDAPVGAKVYPLKSKFTLCSRFSTELMLDLTDGRYECFKDNFGEWACATASGYRVISTKYEKLKKQ